MVEDHMIQLIEHLRQLRKAWPELSNPVCCGRIEALLSREPLVISTGIHSHKAR